MIEETTQMAARAKSNMESVNCRINQSQCKICGKVGAEKRRLPCGCTYCKKCLNDYFKQRVQKLKPNALFNCPHCSSEVKSPNRPITEWTKEFKSQPVLSTFYSMDSDGVAENSHGASVNGGSDITYNRTHNGTNGNNVHQPVPTPRRIRSKHNPEPILETQPLSPVTALLGKDKLAFHSNISSDTRTCQYWSGDVLPNVGCVALADWMNRTVKIFHTSGECKAHFLILVSILTFQLT